MATQAAETELEVELKPTLKVLTYHEDHYSGLLQAGDLPVPDGEDVERLKALVRKSIEQLYKIYDLLLQAERIYKWVKDVASGVLGYLPPSALRYFTSDVNWDEVLRLGKEVFVSGVNSMEAYSLMPMMLHDANLWLGYGARDYPAIGIRNLAAQGAIGIKREYTGYRVWQGESSWNVYWNGRAADAYASQVDVQRPHADALASAAADASSAMRTCFTSGVSFYGNVQIMLVRSAVALVNILANWRTILTTFMNELVTVAGWFGSALSTHINLEGVEGTQTQVLLGARSGIRTTWPDLTGSSNWPVLSADGTRIEYRSRSPQ